MRIFPVIMAGGSGTRFWPLSRQSRPKQFLPLASDRPLIVDTLARLPPLASPSECFVVCGPAHAPTVHELLPELPPDHVLVEPVARNTAPAIGLAAIHVAKIDPKGVLLVLPSDHHIGDTAAFRETLVKAAELASDGALATIGIKPSRPDTGYGYIHLGAPLERPGSFHVERFVEKPDLARAEEYLRSGEYLWNAGIFAFRADVILNEIGLHLPRLSSALQDIGAVLGTDQEASVVSARFPGVESISIDYGVMERGGGIVCVPGNFGWSDVGSFAALPEVRPMDAQGNVTQGEAALIDCRDCVILGSDRPIAAIGVSDLIVVDAGDALLIVPKHRAQEVRAAVEALARSGRGRFV